MLKACAKCGKLHDYNFKCWFGESKRKKLTDAQRFRRTKDWISKSEEIRTDCNFLCEYCKSINIYNFKNLEVHHIIPIEKDYEKRLDNYNLICLCNEHHRQAEKGLIEVNLLLQLVKEREERKV